MPSTKSFLSLFSAKSPLPTEIKKPAAPKDEPAIFFMRYDVNKLAVPYKFSIVGKFSHGRPKLEEIHRFFDLGLEEYGHNRTLGWVSCSPAFCPGSRFSAYLD